MLSKIKVFSFLVIAVLVVGYLATGCGQQVPQVKTEVTTIPQPLGLVIRGTVYGNNQANVKGAALPGVNIVLSGQSITRATTSDANGEYSFTNLPEGTYIIVATKEGYQRTISSSITVGINSNSPVSDNRETVYDITMDNRPVVLSISPAPGSTIEAGVNTITVVFNEPMDQTSVRPTLTSRGARTFAVADTQALSTSWSADGKTLTITTGVLLANNFYRFNLDPNTTARDLSGNLLDTSGGSMTGGGGLSSTIYNSSWYDYRTTSGGVPGAPSGVTLAYYNGSTSKLITSDASTGIDFSDLMSIGSYYYLRLYWNVPSSGGAVTGYKIYAALEGTAGASNYVLLGTTTTNYFYIFSMNDLLSALFGTTSVNPVSTQNYPFINKAVYFKVVAYNGDGESAAAETGGIKEKVGPQIKTTTYKKYGYAGGVMNNYYYLPAIDNSNKKVVYIGLSEPVDSSTITAANFSITAGGGTSVTSATLLTNSSTSLSYFGSGVYAIVRIETQDDMNDSTVIKMGTGVKDLAGNAVAAGTNDTITLTGF